MDNKHAQRYLEAVAQQLQAERAATGLTYKELGAMAELHEQTVMKYLRGKRDIPLMALAAMAEAVGLTPMELVRRARERL